MLANSLAHKPELCYAVWLASLVDSVWDRFRLRKALRSKRVLQLKKICAQKNLGKYLGTMGWLVLQSEMGSTVRKNLLYEIIKPSTYRFTLVISTPRALEKLFFLKRFFY